LEDWPRSGAADGEIFAVEMPVDPDAVHRARAESDVVIGEIMKKPPGSVTVPCCTVSLTNVIS
jgi:hypothetical protein